MEIKFIRLLVIEDQKEHIELIFRSFKAYENKYSIDTARSLEEARNLLNNNDYNIVITDLILPDGNGMEIVKDQKYNSLFPFIVMTSHSDESKAVNAIKSGAIDYIIKTSDSIISLPKIVERSLREWDHITELRKAEKKIREGEKYYREFIDNSLTGIVIADTNGNILQVNSKILEILGSPSEEITKSINMFTFEPLIKAGISEALKECITENKSMLFDQYYTSKWGKTSYLTYNLTPLHNENREITSILINIIDITDRKQAEDALRESEATSRAFMNNTPTDSILLLDTQGVIIDLNEIAAQRLGKSRDKLIGNLADSVLPADVAINRRSKIAQILKASALVRFEDKRDDAWYDTVAYPVMGKDGTIAKIAIVARDITERKHIEEKLRESEERYRIAIESANDGVAIVQNDIHTYVNQKFLDIFGYSTPDEIIGTQRSYIVHPDYQEVVNAYATARTKDEYAPTKYEFKGLKKNGDTVDIEVSVNTIIYKGERGILAYLRDVTERKRTEDALKESEAKYSMLVEKANDGVAIIQKGVFQFINKIGAKLSGYEVEELINKPISILIAEESKDTIAAMTQKLLSGEEVLDNFEVKYIRKNGIIRDVEISGKLVSYLDKPAVLAIIRDVTERKKIEKALIESEEKYRTLQENLPVGLVRTTPEGNVIFANPALVKIFGYESLTEFLNINVSDLYSNTEDRKSLLHKLETEGLVINFETQMRKKDGTIIWVSTSINAIFNDEGKFISLDGFCKDISARKKTELALKRNEELYSALFQNIPVQTVVVDKKGRVIAFNKAKESSGDRLPKIGEIMYKDYASKHNIDMYNELLKCIDIGKMSEFPELPYNDRVLSIKFSPFEEGAIIISQDITDQKNAEEKLRESEERYRLIADNMLDLIALCDADGKTKFISPSSKQVLGYSYEENLGESVFNLIHPEDKDRIIKSYEELKNSKLQISEVFRSYHKDGYYIWLETYGHSIFNSNGEYIGAVLSSRDITARKLAEEKIEHLNELLIAIRNVDRLIAKEKNTEKLIQGICDSLIQSRGHKNIWIVLTDNKNDIIAATDSGFGNKFKNFIRNQKNLSFLNCFNHIINNSGIIVMHDYSSCDGCRFTIEDQNISRVVIQLKHNNKIYGLINVGVLKEFINEEQEKALIEEVAEDIAYGLYNIELEKERKELQKQLYRSARLSAVGQLAAGIAHEFNNMLSIILGHTQLSLEEDSIDEIKKSLTEIEKTTKRGSGIVIKLATFAKPKEPDFRPQEINKIIEDVIRLQERQLHLESIKIETKLNIKSKVSLDRGQIEQVFFNLLINSIHAIKPKGGGKIIISAKETGGNIEISFSDNGTGIDNQIKSKVFDPFFTTKGAWAKDGLGISGTGLGLSIAHSIIKHHNGIITVKSQKNKGTTFIIKLPIDTSNQVEEEKIEYNISHHDIEKIRGMRILLVDDENEMTDIFNQFFKKAGFQNFKIENNGEKAVSIFKEFKPDIVFLDIIMPEMSGEMIFKEIKAIDKKTPVVFMSGKIDAEKDLYIKNGAFDYIQKPFEINEIYQMLSRIIKSGDNKIPAYSR